ncbi:antibiotic biosynthesis monooxygenase [Motiliproteus coralliicola]|uniref:Antibiotic biosynthesis monooxygenase n=1 Tax=Motiliproteus coralliicola TaxID=2283196 RepID=A0A369W7Z3_9GAMM|nr:antibiotic biosynthesis monooxygenase [Motiliproteus coralliicola]RDE18128.1 antibiotic biosynthesis monooxygenase [Motiliproteus coralliicola]
MYIAMNRFRIKPGCEEDFEQIWRQRETFLDEVDGFVSFNLLRGPTNDEQTLYASHSVWRDRQAFEDWTRSEAFRKAHTQAGASRKDVFLGPPQLECFEAIL